MALKDLLKKRDKKRPEEPEDAPPDESIPDITFLRTDTHTQEVISPPAFDSDTSPTLSRDKSTSIKRPSRFRSSSNASSTSKDSKRGEKRLSSLLNLRSHSHESRATSVNVPTDLPNIEDDNEGHEEKEAQWEKRATMLAQGNTNLRKNSLGNPESTLPTVDTGMSNNRVNGGRPVATRQISDAKGDDDIQEAIALHEAGDLEKSTAMFGRLANPNGANNALSQVLYGLALRHGWGIPQDPSLAITYLSQAAANSATVESQALSSGMSKGGAAKGELVLAIYELANCFRHGWGVDKDPVAARSYYETAANLGDTDAMNEVARCYEEGFGGKKDKFIAAKYYRQAEASGSKTLGNSWIWKDKYNPKASGSQRES